MKAPTEPGFYWANIGEDEWVFVRFFGPEEDFVDTWDYGCMDIERVKEWGDPLLRNPYPERPKQSVELEKLSKALIHFEDIESEAAEIINEAIIFMDTLGPMLKLEQRTPKDTIP